MHWWWLFIKAQSAYSEKNIWINKNYHWSAAVPIFCIMVRFWLDWLKNHGFVFFSKPDRGFCFISCLVCFHSQSFSVKITINDFYVINAFQRSLELLLLGFCSSRTGMAAWRQAHMTVQWWAGDVTSQPTSSFHRIWIMPSGPSSHCIIHKASAAFSLHTCRWIWMHATRFRMHFWIIIPVNNWSKYWSIVKDFTEINIQTSGAKSFSKKVIEHQWGF